MNQHEQQQQQRDPHTGRFIDRHGPQPAHERPHRGHRLDQDSHHTHLDRHGQPDPERRDRRGPFVEGER